MTPDDAARLLAACAAFDNRQPSEIAMRAWAKSLEDLPLDEDCFAAVARFYGTPPDKAGERLWIQPHDVRTHRRILRAERLANFVYEPPPDDEPGTRYAVRYRRQLSDVASGRVLGPAQAPALTGGPHPAVAERLAGIGRTVPDDDPEVAAVRRPGPLGRDCPTCRAAIGCPCKTPRGKRCNPHAARKAHPAERDPAADVVEQQRRQEAARQFLAALPPGTVVAPPAEEPRRSAAGGEAP